jgi:hypothetical protein
VDAEKSRMSLRGGEEAMVVTSDAVRHELARIEVLIEVLRNSVPIADDDFQDLYG